MPESLQFNTSGGVLQTMEIIGRETAVPDRRLSGESLGQLYENIGRLRRRFLHVARHRGA